MQITASGLRERCSRRGIAKALEEKYVEEINDALQAVWETPSDTNYISKRIYNVGLPTHEYEDSVKLICNYFNQMGFKTKFWQENLLTISW